MASGRNTSLRLLGVVLLGAALYGGYWLWEILLIGTAYEAKVLCSSVFVSRRDPQQVLRQELEGIFEIVDSEVDRDNLAVTARLPGMPEQRAVYRAGLGCTLLAGVPEAELRRQASGLSVGAGEGGRVGEVADPSSGEPVSSGAPPPASEALRRALAGAFAEPDPSRPVRTRALVIQHHGRVVAERYAPGFSQETPLAGWSMTKSVTSALVGILVSSGKLALDEPAPVPEWQSPGDPRAAITIDHLLRMSSGLDFDDRSGAALSDVNRMLLRSPDAAGYAVEKPLQDAPGSAWYYSSGTTNILSRIIRARIGGTDADYWAFARRALFDRIGMPSAVMEPDASGTFVGSSFMYATARDWARFGQLYLQDGVWNGERILPEGWVAYTRRPAPAAPHGRYGAHFWLNGGEAVPVAERPFPSLPADLHYAAGYEGQYVIVIPSRELVIVRLGQTADRQAWRMDDFVAAVLAAIDGS